MLDPGLIGALLQEIGRLPEYAAQLGLIGAFFADLGRSIWEHVLARNDDLRRAIAR